MNVNDLVQIRIADAARRIEAARRRRAELDAARQHGLAQRHASKLRHQAAGVATPDDPQANRAPVENPIGTKEKAMSERTLTPGPATALTDDIREHGYAIVQTRIERVPARYRRTKCGRPDGCTQNATLMTLAVAEVNMEGPDLTGLTFARDHAGVILHFPVCDDHRSEATHVLYFALTGRERPDGINAIDVLGQHMNWL